MFFGNSGRPSGASFKNVPFLFQIIIDKPSRKLRMNIETKRSRVELNDKFSRQVIDLGFIQNPEDQKPEGAGNFGKYRFVMYSFTKCTKRTAVCSPTNLNCRFVGHRYS